MMISDGTIHRYMDQGYIKVEPMPDDNAFQPASLELTLGDRFAFPTEFDIYRPSVRLINDADHLQKWTAKEFAERTWTDICIGPAEFMLGHTFETITIPNDVVAQVNGKSSLARLGLQVHSTAGFIDPGFRGQITLELKNLSKQPIWLKAGQRIAQLAFFLTNRPVDRPYGHPDLGSHYQDQVGPTRTRDRNGYEEVTLPGL